MEGISWKYWIRQLLPRFSDFLQPVKADDTLSVSGRKTRYKKPKNPFKRPGRARRALKKAGSLKARVVKKAITSIQLVRPASNPILSPHGRNQWEAQATFNPAAIYADGKVHLIYRAVGNDDVSVLGYAYSHDGLHIHERLADPAYVASRDPKGDRTGVPLDYASGGGGDGGCEDPRLTLIDGIAYLLYTAFDGWGSIRIGMSKISLDDFIAKRWNWSKPVLISPPGEVHKNWVLFPEKINGKFAILHSISPKLRIDYFDSLDELDGETSFLRSRYVKAPRSRSWDSWVRGAGPPPIWTKYGWLLLYHAMDHRDPDRYKLGAMLLDLKEPNKVLYRSKGPILEPNECYENEGFKAGVVYSCGAVVIEGKLFVYYGGADTVVCVATADLNHFLAEIMSSRVPSLKGIAGPKKKSYARHKKITKKSHPVA